MFSLSQEKVCDPPSSSRGPVTYGELIVLGFSCNGSLPSADKGRRKSRFALCRRNKANGVKPSTVHSSCTPQAAKAISNKEQHSISYTLSRAQTVVVEYTQDGNTDMFQIGRSTESPIDFVVTDMSPGGLSPGGPAVQSTISRFACRIICQRNAPHSAQIYAAGFDSSKNIFLGEKAAKWRTPAGQMDALTTNGVLVMHPRPGFSQDSGPGLWREVSVCGSVFTLRGSRSSPQRGQKVDSECNQLMDGSLVDLCGATLLWRTAEGLRATPTVRHLEALRRELNAGRPQCPVGLATLAFPSLGRQDAPGQQQPWVYLRCGHVHGYHGWGGAAPPRGGGGLSGERVPHVPGPGPLRAAVAGLRGGRLRGRRAAHARLGALRPRLLGEDGGLLESDPAAPRHPHLPGRLPLLHPAAGPGARLHQAHLPEPAGLDLDPGLDLD